MRMSRREERERILGMIEFTIQAMGESTYERYSKKVLSDLIKLIEANDNTKGDDTN